MASLIACSKMKEEKDDLKMQLFIKREADFINLGHSQPIHTEKKASSGEYSKDVVKKKKKKEKGKKTTDKEISQPSQQKAEAIV